MSINEPLTEDNPTLPLNTLPTDSETQLSSKQRLYISLMKPGRLSYWLAIDDSFMKTIIHYFAFVVFPVLVAVILSTVRYELSSEYVVRHSFSASSWATMNTPIAFTLLIPIVIVVTKCIINLVRYNSIPKHLLLLQFGRVSFFCLWRLIIFIALSPLYKQHPHRAHAGSLSHHDRMAMLDSPHDLAHQRLGSFYASLASESSRRNAESSPHVEGNHVQSAGDFRDGLLCIVYISRYFHRRSLLSTYDSLFFIDITFGHFPTSPLLYHRHGCDACFFSDLVLICSSY